LGPAAAPKRAGGRRYALGLAGLLGPAQASPAGSGLRPPRRSAGPKKGAAMLAAPEFKAKNIDWLTL